MSDETKAVKEEPISPLVTVAGKEVDMRKALPLTLGDFRKLKKNHNVEQKDLGGGDIEITVRFTHYLLSKANPAVTEEDVDSLTMEDLNTIMKTLTTKDFMVVDRPT